MKPTSPTKKTPRQDIYKSLLAEILILTVFYTTICFNQTYKLHATESS